jgi:hypothetical protein
MQKKHRKETEEANEMLSHRKRVHWRDRKGAGRRGNSSLDTWPSRALQPV